MSRARLSLDAEFDLDEIRIHLMKEGGTSLVRHVNVEIRKGIRFVADNPGAGHSREDLTDEPVKFWSVFSYLIVYDPTTKPIGIARVLHGAQDIETIFRQTPPRMG